MGYRKWARVSSFKNIGDEDIENKFVGVFPSNHRNKFINHKLMISEKKKGKYPFIIANTDVSSKSGTHWWSILDIEPKQAFFLWFVWNWWLKKLYYSGG